MLDVRRMRAETLNLMHSAMGFTSSAITPESTVRTFSGGERQGVAITRALYFKAELVILDEPTMGLSLSETKKSLDFVDGIRRAGQVGIFIDHNIFHVYPVVDRIVVLDRGTVAGQFMKTSFHCRSSPTASTRWPVPGTWRRSRGDARGARRRE